MPHIPPLLHTMSLLLYYARGHMRCEPALFYFTLTFQLSQGLRVFNWPHGPWPFELPLYTELGHIHMFMVCGFWSSSVARDVCLVRKFHSPFLQDYVTSVMTLAVTKNITILLVSFALHATFCCIMKVHSSCVCHTLSKRVASGKPFVGHNSICGIAPWILPVDPSCLPACMLGGLKRPHDHDSRNNTLSLSSVEVSGSCVHVTVLAANGVQWCWLLHSLQAWAIHEENIIRVVSQCQLHSVPQKDSGSDDPLVEVTE